MAEEPSTIFQTCSAQFSSEDNLPGLLECLSDQHAADHNSLGAGVDTFYLIFAGALVYFVSNNNSDLSGSYFGLIISLILSSS